MWNDLLAFLTKNWAYVAFAFLLFVTALIVLISFIVAMSKGRHIDRMIAEQSNSVRVYVINVPDSKVLYFNVNSPSHMKQESLTDFYQHFPSSEQEKVINWVNALSDPTTKAPDFLETDINDSHDKRQYFSMLQVMHVNAAKGIVHIQSFLMKYMAASRANSLGINDHGLTSLKEMQSIIALNGKKRGVSLCFRFAYERAHEKGKEIDPIVFNQLINALSPFLQPKRYLLQASGNELILCDLHMSERAQGLFLIRSGLNSINRYLSINGLSSIIKCRVGAVVNRLFQGDGEAVLTQARKMAQVAFEEEGADPIVWYEKGRESKMEFTDFSYRTEVERIINEKRISYFFRPIYSTDEKNVIGYISKAEPKDTYFESIEELKDYAMKTEDDRQLFATVARNTLPVFATERPNPHDRLFFSVRIEERGYMIPIFQKIPSAKDTSIVFLFSEDDLRNHVDVQNTDALIVDMDTLRAKGYQVALSFSGGTPLSLPQSLYAAIDFFVCSFAFASTASDMDTKIRSSLHSTVERLLKHHKTIIATDVQGWPSIELLVRSGIHCISSNDLSPYQQMILPINPKLIKRINDFK